MTMVSPFIFHITLIPSFPSRKPSLYRGGDS